MKEPQVLVAPKSRLIPSGAEAILTCKFSNAGIQEPYWKVNKSEANIVVNRNYLRSVGIFIEDNIASPGANGNQEITLTLRADGSYATVNNTNIKCKIGSTIESTPATILTIAGKFIIDYRKATNDL